MAARLAAALGIFYAGPLGPAAICFERNGPGEMFAKAMTDLQYPSLWYERKPPSAVHNNGLTMRVGWNNTQDSKEYVLGNYRGAMVDGRFINPSAASLSECGSYQYDDQMRITAPFDRTKARDDPARVKHGDRVIADALLNLCFDWTWEPPVKPGPAFEAGTYGQIFGMDKRFPKLFAPEKQSMFVPCDRHPES